MRKNIDMYISELQVNISPAQYKNIVAFAEVLLIDDNGEVQLKFRGFTVKLKNYGKDSKPELSVDFPAFRTKIGFQKSVIAEQRALYDLIVKTIMEEYYQKTGDLSPEELESREKVRPDKLPKGQM